MGAVKNKQRGFSLLEALVASLITFTIVTILSSFLYGAFRHFHVLMQKPQLQHDLNNFYVGDGVFSNGFFNDAQAATKILYFLPPQLIIQTGQPNILFRFLMLQQGVVVDYILVPFGFGKNNSIQRGGVIVWNPGWGFVGIQQPGHGLYRVTTNLQTGQVVNVQRISDNISFINIAHNIPIAVGQDGVCNTQAQVGDVQLIPTGQRVQAWNICVDVGNDMILDTTIPDNIDDTFLYILPGFDAGQKRYEIESQNVGTIFPQGGNPKICYYNINTLPLGANPDEAAFIPLSFCRITIRFDIDTDNDRNIINDTDERYDGVSIDSAPVEFIGNKNWIIEHT